MPTYQVAVCPICKITVFPNQIVKCEKCTKVGCVKCMNLAADGKGICKECINKLPLPEQTFWTMGAVRIQLLKKNLLIWTIIAIIGLVLAFVGSGMWQNNPRDDAKVATGLGLTMVGLAICSIGGCGITKNGRKINTNQLK